MKNIKYMSLSIACLAFVGCKKISQDYDKNPNDPIKVPSEFSLNASMVATQLVQSGSSARLAGMITKSFTGVDRQYIPLNTYTITASEFDDVWANNYVAVITNAKLAEDQAKAAGDLRQVGIAQILQAHAYGTFTSLFGDIPFSEAVQPDKYQTPKFDPQVSVYSGLQSLLSEAISNLGSSNAINPAAAAKDFYFGGDASKWIAVAHSLKARYFLHTRNYVSAISEAQQGISNAANDWKTLHGGTEGVDGNIYFDFGNNQRPGYMDASDSYAIDLLNSPARNNAKTDETKRKAFFFDAEDLNYEGGIFAVDASFPMVTFAETKLIAAEANLKSASVSTTAALTALNDVRNYYVTSSLYDTASKYDALVVADFNTGGLYNPGTLAPAAAMLKEILTEKYLNMVGTIEQFNDVRRTKNLVGIIPRAGTKLPQRYLYPQAEINSNPNTPAQGTSDLYTETTIWNSAY
jgi:starch-binding outer membrane protein, SusD/RagB family